MRRLALGLAVIVAVLGFPGVAVAHGQLAYSVPANQSTVTGPLDSVALYFTERPASDATFTITSPSGIAVYGNWSSGAPAPLASPMQELNLVNGTWQPVYYNTGFPALVTATHWPEQGVYTVHYETVASDGDKVRGDIRFDYQGPLTTAPPPAATLPNPQSTSTTWIWWTIAATVLIGLAAYLLLRRPRSSRPSRAHPVGPVPRARSTSRSPRR
jgi:methionine-rich copper-binding protein CopC